jgi:hypothetical protein
MITAYELCCGCQDSAEAKDGGTVTIWREHGVYHVREWDRETGRREWNSFRTLAPARQAFRRASCGGVIRARRGK